MCGVRFMAETVKILSPEKHVYLSNPIAGCPMAEQMDVDLIEAVKAKYPDHTVVAYINTTADLKCICDVCVTSSSAVKIVKQLPNSKILFIPDCNLGAYVKNRFRKRTSNCSRAAARFMLLFLLRIWKRQRQDIPKHWFWYIRNASPIFVTVLITLVPHPALLPMPSSPMQPLSSLEQKLALQKPYSMPARTSNSIH